jgi:hypothetical protein
MNSLSALNYLICYQTLSNIALGIFLLKSLKRCKAFIIFTETVIYFIENA